MRAVERRAPVIYQAAMFDGRFVGFADFLVLRLEAGTQYRLRDTKLARSVKVEALLQLAAYADTLAAAGVPVAPEVELVLGDGATATYRVDELLPVYLPRRAALQRLLDDHLAGGAAVSWDDDKVRACFRCPECTIQVRDTDDLLLVAGMRVSQRARLIEAGITTLSALAQHDGPVPQLPARTVASLTAQARLQIAPRVHGKPPYEIADPQPLNLLPDPNKGDLFFDFEGDPLWTTDGHEWGLEYMWGVLEVGGAFRPLWAHDRASERRALVDFLAMVRKRRKRYPKMHIYHYAAYEKTALLRLAGRYGVGEDEVDDLLRSGVLVDLFPLVRKSIRVGTENYSLKSLEPLYMGSELRSGDVTTATESITMYARYCELRADGRGCALAEADNVLKEIEDYNRYDCRSTHKLRDWLIKIAIESGVPPLGPQPVADGTAVEDTDDLARTLMAFAGDGVEERSPAQTAVALLAAARGYHRREDKPFWWAHFDRLNNPVDEWGDTSDVFLADDVGAVVKDWHLPSSRARKQQRWVKLTGTLAAGGLDSNVFALYNPPSPAGLSRQPGPARRRQRRDHRRRRPGRPDRSDHLRAGAQGRRDVRATAVRADAGQALPDRQAARFHRHRGRRRRCESAQSARQRDRRHPAAPHPAHPQWRTAAPHGRHRLGHHGGAARPRLVLPGGARPARHRQDIHGGQDHCHAGERPPMAGRRRGAVTCGGGEPVPRFDQGRCRPRADRQEGLAAGRRMAGGRQGRLRRIRRHERRLRDRRHRMGFRQRHPGRREQPRPAGDRGGRPVLPGQHHRGGAERPTT